ACAVPSCSSGTLTTPTCNGLGVCQPHPTSCSPYVCAAGGNACATSCANDAGCIASYHCRLSDSTCQPDFANGQVFIAASQCTSGNCVDGFCCDSPCGGVCQACAAAKTAGANGACGPIKGGTDPDNECTADAASTCQHNGFCDGAGACQLYAN